MGIWILCSHRGEAGLEFCILWIERKGQSCLCRNEGWKAQSSAGFVFIQGSGQEGICALLCRNKDFQEGLEILIPFPCPVVCVHQESPDTPPAPACQESTPSTNSCWIQGSAMWAHLPHPLALIPAHSAGGIWLLGRIQPLWGA